MGNSNNILKNQNSQPVCAKCNIMLCDKSYDTSKYYWNKYCANCRCTYTNCRHKKYTNSLICKQHTCEYYEVLENTRKKQQEEWYNDPSNPYGYVYSNGHY